MMFQQVIVCIVLLCVEVNMGLLCTSSHTTGFKLSINNRRNLTGHWIAQVQLEHESGEKEVEPYNLHLQHTTVKCEGGGSVIIVATVTASPQRPGPDYELVPDMGYYKMHISGKTWYQAREICASEGAYLAFMNSEKEADIIKGMWKRYPKLFDDWRNTCAFVGIHDNYSEGNYITIFGQSINSTGYTKWYPNEPGEGTSGNCGCIGREGSLADTGCNNQLAFFCEQQL